MTNYKYIGSTRVKILEVILIKSNIKRLCFKKNSGTSLEIIRS